MKHALKVARRKANNLDIDISGTSDRDLRVVGRRCKYRDRRVTCIFVAIHYIFP